MKTTRPQALQHPAAQPAEPVYRSGAAALLAKMPVATLRVWERRYQISASVLTPTGRRLYSAQDVARLTLIKRLSDQGHGIAQLAPLDMAALDAMAWAQGTAQGGGERRPGALAAGTPALPWRVGVIGAPLALRLTQKALMRELGRPLQVLGVFDDAAQANQALALSVPDALLVYAPSLHETWRHEFDRAAPALVGVPKAVLFEFAPDALGHASGEPNVALLRDPRSAAQVGQWLARLAAAWPGIGQSRPPRQGTEPPPRQWTDSQLTAFAAMPTSVACECPRHIAELLQVLAHFENYSADCQNRNPADAHLHAYLAQIAGSARVSFEAALERVALHEGLALPLRTTQAVV